MPALIEGAVDLVLIAGVLVIIGMILAAQHTLLPLVQALHRALGWIPGAGAVLGAVESALNTALNAAYRANQQVLADLFTGLIWSFQTSAHALRTVALDTERALDHLTHVTIPAKIEAATNRALGIAATTATELGSTAHTLATEIVHLTGTVAHDLDLARTYTDAQVARAETVAAQTVATAALTLSHDAAALVHGLDVKLGGRIDDLLATDIPHLIERDLHAGGTIARAIADAVTGAATGAGAAVEAVIGRDLGSGGTIARAIGDAVAAGGAVSAAAVEAVIGRDLGSGGTIARAIEGAVAGVAIPGLPGIDEINRAVAAALSAALAEGGTVAHAIATAIPAALPNVPGIAVPSNADLAAGLAALAATVGVVTAETGLDRAACRSKVKGVCGTDPGAWAGMLAGLAALDVALSLDALIAPARTLLGEAATGLRELA